MSGFDLARVNDGVKDTVFHGKLRHFASIGSTNTFALAEAQAGAPSGQVYLADEQTAGRGRGGHTWHSEPDHGLYLTMLVRPQLQGTEVLKLSMLTGVAAVNAVSSVLGRDIIDLRWPNDLVTRLRPARKVGGILTEAATAPSGAVRYAAIGIGINLNQTEFPADLVGTASSLRQEAGTAISREQLAIAFLRQMDGELCRVQSIGPASDDICTRFQQHSTWVYGKRVQVAEDEGYTGVTAGLTLEGLLRVACDDGTQRVVRHGGVREL